MIICKKYCCYFCKECNLERTIKNCGNCKNNLKCDNCLSFSCEIEIFPDKTIAISK